MLQIGLNCEAFSLPTSQLRALPKGSYPDTKWIYEHDGATFSRNMSITVQGEDADAVVLLGLRVVDFERSSVPGNLAHIGCDATGGEQPTRYLDVILSDPPRIVSKPGIDDAGKVTQPAAKFPFKVSNSDPEFFELEIGGPPCLCTWRLALDWTSKGRKGTTIIGRDSDKIITDLSEPGVSSPERPEYYYYVEDKWDPPLPK